MSGYAIAELISRMELVERRLHDAGDERRHFHSTYLRTTRAVAADLAAGGFVDSEWAEHWDVVFASLYLDAVEQWDTRGSAPGPWQVAFSAAAGPDRLAPLRHVLLGINAHVNFDLPQALLAVITDEEFDDAAIVRKRAADHEHIDSILVDRVAAEDAELAKVELPGDRTRIDRLLQPLNRFGTKRFLKEARRKVWHNARILQRARVIGDDELRRRIKELGELASRRVSDLVAPRYVILKLARSGFGVELPDEPTS